MRLWSEAWHNGEALPLRFASGQLRTDGRLAPGPNLNPPLLWADLPPGSQSLALLCHDFDALEAANRCTAAATDAPRGDFYHWVLVDLPAASAGLAEGQWRQGFRPGGHAPAAAPPASGPREGLNDFGRWYAGQPGLAGAYTGYDGPCLWPHDPLVHHLLFTLYALDTARLALPWPFTGPRALQAMAGHVLGSATLSGTFAAASQAVVQPLSPPAPAPRPAVPGHRPQQAQRA